MYLNILRMIFLFYGFIFFGIVEFFWNLLMYVISINEYLIYYFYIVICKYILI